MAQRKSAIPSRGDASSKARPSSDFLLAWFPSKKRKVGLPDRLGKISVASRQQPMDRLLRTYPGGLVREFAIEHHESLPHGSLGVPEVAQPVPSGLSENSQKVIGSRGGGHPEGTGIARVVINGLFLVDVFVFAPSSWLGIHSSHFHGLQFLVRAHPHGLDFVLHVIRGKRARNQALCSSPGRSRPLGISLQSGLHGRTRRWVGRSIGFALGGLFVRKVDPLADHDGLLVGPAGHL